MDAGFLVDEISAAVESGTPYIVGLFTGSEASALVAGTEDDPLVSIEMTAGGYLRITRKTSSVVVDPEIVTGYGLRVIDAQDLAGGHYG